MSELKKLKLETKKHVGICKQHGKYESIKSMIMGKMVGGKCPSCVDVYEKQEKKPSIHINPVPKRFNTCTFESFEQDEHNSSACKYAYNYASKFSKIKANGGSMIFYGTCGTGKTHLACSIANKIVSDNAGDVMYTKIYELTGSIKDTWSNSDASESDVIKQYTDADLLIIDEVGVQFGSEAEQMILFRVLNKRYEDIKPTIIVSNLDDKGLDKYLGERIIDRMYEGGGGMIAFDWDSRRRK